MFKVVDVDKVDPIFSKVGKEWMLITAGKLDNFNTMTASWGSLGVLWFKNIAQIFVRPNRHTFKYIEENDYFTLCFFGNNHKDILTYCGTHSGKDVNKIEETGLMPDETKMGNVYFKQAELVLECKKIYEDTIKPDKFTNTKFRDEIYTKGQYHKTFIGSIITAMVYEQ